MSARFSGQTVLVAGGTGGLGQALSLAFLAEGASVTVTYRDQAGFDALTRAAGANGVRLEGIQVDVADEAAVARVVNKIVGRHDRLDVLVNAVGGYAAGTPLWELDTKTFEQMLTLNLRSGFVLARAVVPAMLAEKRGAIVNVASRAAVDHAARSAAYAASKAAAVAMTDSLAADLTGTGVRANSILPSIIDTPANRNAMPKADFAAWPKPEEIADVILFLCSDAAKLIHGATIPV